MPALSAGVTNSFLARQRFGFISCGREKTHRRLSKALSSSNFYRKRYLTRRLRILSKCPTHFSLSLVSRKASSERSRQTEVCRTFGHAEARMCSPLHIRASNKVANFEIDNRALTILPVRNDDTYRGFCRCRQPRPRRL